MIESSFLKNVFFLTQGQHFEQLMCCLSKLYDSCAGSHLDLVLDFWCPVETGANMSSVGDRYSSRQVSLYKFLRLAGDLLMPSLYTPYILMLASLSRNSQVHPTAVSC